MITSNSSRFVVTERVKSASVRGVAGRTGPRARHVERLCEQSQELIMVAGRVRDREDAPCLS
jgi:hypothetical protein